MAIFNVANFVGTENMVVYISSVEYDWVNPPTAAATGTAAAAAAANDDDDDLLSFRECCFSPH